MPSNAQSQFWLGFRQFTPVAISIAAYGLVWGVLAGLFRFIPTTGTDCFGRGNPLGLLVSQARAKRACVVSTANIDGFYSVLIRYAMNSEISSSGSA